MKYLIDTNILIWFIEKNEKIPSEIKRVMLDEKSIVYVSIISFWEIAIKYSLGKLKFPKPLVEIFDELSDEDYFSILPVTPKHILKHAELPFHHRDPFDRLIFAQAKVENVTFLFTDEIFKKYEKQ